MIYCDKCGKKISCQENYGKELKKMIAKIKKLTFDDFHENKKASGGQHFWTKIGNEKISMFIDMCGNARIAIDSEGKWLAGVDFKHEKPEKLLKILQKLL